MPRRHCKFSNVLSLSFIVPVQYLNGTAGGLLLGASVYKYIAQASYAAGTSRRHLLTKTVRLGTVYRATMTCKRPGSLTLSEKTA